MLNILLVSAGLLFSTTITPVGENSSFLMNRAYTSNAIRSGEIAAEVVGQSEAGYATQIDCAFRVNLIGEMGGTTFQDLPADLLDGVLLQELRETGEYLGEDFKVKHKGYETITLQNGTVLPNADKIHVYDINHDVADNKCFTRLLDIYTPAASVEDLDITGWAHESLPLAGLARVVIKGKVSGVRFQIGLDHTE